MLTVKTLHSKTQTSEDLLLLNRLNVVLNAAAQIIFTSAVVGIMARYCRDCTYSVFVL